MRLRRINKSLSLLIILCIISQNLNAKTLGIKQSHISKQQLAKSLDEQGDDFNSSALEITILGPRIKYPRQPSDFTTSSQRRFTGGQINTLPFSSPAEALEIVPGLAVGR